jgi:hypothetical protein
MKGSLTLLLANQALDSLKNSETRKLNNRLDKEVQESVNNSLLLGLILEGLINEIGCKTVDTWTWKELERSSTPLKWRIISGLKKGFEPGKEPLQTITKIKKLRDEIAHPKNIDLGNDVYLISDKGEIKINPTDDYILPKENFNIYLGFGTLYKKFNFETSLKNTEKVFDAITEIVELFEMKSDYGWIFEIKEKITGYNKKYK